MPADQETTAAQAKPVAPVEVSKETATEAPKVAEPETPKETTAPVTQPATEPVAETATAPVPPPKEAPAAPPKDDEAPATPPKDAETPAAAVAPVETSLSKLSTRLPEIIKSVGHSEMWGVQLGDPNSHVPTKVVLQKFLKANNDAVASAEKQLTEALEWRKKTNPAALIDGSYDESKFGGLGYLTTHKDDAGKETVVTWNIYGAVKDFKATFGDLDGFIKWRTALMELSVRQLDLASVTEPIPEDGQDPYQMIQVHDYLSISFLIPPSHVKAASSKTIELFSTVYPELLSHKYFVNVPVIMGWMFAAMKRIIAPATLMKLHMISAGDQLAAELPTIAATLPKEYGGKGPGVKEQGQGVTLVGAKAEAPKEAPADAAATTVPEPKAEEARPVEEKPVVAAPAAAETKEPEQPKPVAPATTEEAPKVEAVTQTLADTKLDEKPAETKAA